MRRLPGSHEPNNKNRSSKHLGWLTKIKPIVRCMRNGELEETPGPAAKKEIERRKKLREKKSSKATA